MKAIHLRTEYLKNPMGIDIRMSCSSFSEGTQAFLEL